MVAQTDVQNYLHVLFKDSSLRFCFVTSLRGKEEGGVNLPYSWIELRGVRLAADVLAAQCGGDGV